MFVVVVMKLGWVVYNKVGFFTFSQFFLLVRGRCGDVVQEEVQVGIFDFFCSTSTEKTEKKEEKRNKRNSI